LATIWRDAALSVFINLLPPEINLFPLEPQAAAAIAELATEFCSAESAGKYSAIRMLCHIVFQKSKMAADGHLGYTKIATTSIATSLPIYMVFDDINRKSFIGCGPAECRLIASVSLQGGPKK